MISILRGLAFLGGLWLFLKHGASALSVLGPSLTAEGAALIIDPRLLLLQRLGWAIFGLALILLRNRLFEFKGLSSVDRGAAAALQAAALFAFHSEGYALSYRLVPKQRSFAVLNEMVTETFPLERLPGDSSVALGIAVGISAILICFAGPIVKWTPRLWSGLPVRPLSPDE